MNRHEVFKNEYQFIKNARYLKSLKTMVELLPDYFFEVPASSTGKYHPEYALGNGGLVRHTKAAIRIAYELLIDESIGNVFNEDEKDLIIMALLLHDGLKSGLVKTEYTTVNHPLLISNYIKENKAKLELKEEEVNLLCEMIETHMGPWNKDYKGNVVLPVPRNKYQKFVHMCDYLASKKFLNVNFVNNQILE